ncbi:MAG: glycosyltransferase family A protein [Nitrospiraceae bacterium]|nr:glycosyltransferase family A protein [Nitrospiraceae bacterium]
MPLYNKEDEVDRAVRSVLNQTVSDFELVIVNDGSTDKGPQVVRAIEDQRIRIVDQTNQGVSAARNRGIEEASAELIAFLDADDEWMPDFLETIIDLKEKFPCCKVFATRYLIASDYGERTSIINGILGGG